MEQIKAEMKPAGLEMDVDRVQFALALKTWRIRSGKTQEQVAKDWGVSRYSVMRAEAGRDVSWRMAYRLFARLARELEREASTL